MSCDAGNIGAMLATLSDQRWMQQLDNLRLFACFGNQNNHPLHNSGCEGN